MTTQSVKVGGGVIYSRMTRFGELDTLENRKTPVRLQHTGDGFPPNKVLVGGDKWVFLICI